MTIAFEGTRYHGFQVQKNAISVCEVFQNAVEKVLGFRYDVKGCSRTDAGVHACMYCVSIKIDTQIQCEGLTAALNGVLPDDIAVLSAIEVPEDFHARYSCVGKQYVYKLYNSRVKDPFSPKLMYRYGHPIDADFLNAQGKHFIGTHDFAAFQSVKSDITDTIRTITDFTVERQDKIVLFKVDGDGFLYNMVRIMVGTLIFIGMGKLEADSIPSIIASKNRDNAGKTMPAHGLYLNRVYYDNSIVR